MSGSRLGDKKTKRCERIIGLPIIRPPVTESHFVAECFVNKETAYEVDYKEEKILSKAVVDGRNYTDNYFNLLEEEKKENTLRTNQERQKILDNIHRVDL